MKSFIWFATSTEYARVSVARGPRGLVVTFAGEIDDTLASSFGPVVAAVETAGLPVTADLHAVRFFGAWGLHALLALARAAPPGQFAINSPSTAARTTLAASGMTWARQPG